MGTLAEDDGVVVLDLDNAVGLEGGGELGPGLGEGAGHGEGQDGEEEKSTLHVVVTRCTGHSPVDLLVLWPSPRKVGCPSSLTYPLAPHNNHNRALIGQHFQSSATPGPTRRRISSLLPKEMRNEIHIQQK